MTEIHEEPFAGRTRLVVAHADTEYVNAVSRYFRRKGWIAHPAPTGREARRLAGELAPTLVILGTELPDESGWLTCDKLLQEHPGQKVVLVADHWRPDNRRFAAFVGAAALVHREAGFQALAEVWAPRRALISSW